MILAASSSNITAQGSSRLAVSTVIGMVLGVLAFLGMIVSYQLLARHPKRPSSIRALAPPQPKPLPLLSRFCMRCTTLFQSAIWTRATTNQHQTSTHRTLRSFHLTPKRRQQRDAMRKKFSSTLRLNLDVLRNDVSEKASSRTPMRSKFHRLQDDDEGHVGLLKPDAAVLSPWSPSEEYYPMTPPPLFTETLGPSTPPPAYVPGLPLRHVHHERKPYAAISEPKPCTAATAQQVPDESENTKSLIEEIEAVMQYTKDWVEDPFVVADDDDDAVSDTSSDWGTGL